MEEGATFHATIADCVRASNVVITMVGFPSDVEDVYFTRENIMDSTEAGKVLIDMTTTSPALSKKLYDEGKRRGLSVLDAPVTRRQRSPHWYAVHSRRRRQGCV